MREINYVGLLPKEGIIAVMGRDLEVPVIKALAYAREEDKDLYLFPLSPAQSDLASFYKIPVETEFPDMFFLQADRKYGDVIVAGRLYSPSLARLMLRVSHEPVVFLFDRYHTFSVEYVGSLTKVSESIVSVYGEIVDRRNTHLGTVVAELIPYRDDYPFLRGAITSEPLVVDVGIFEDEGYKKLLVKR